MTDYTMLGLTPIDGEFKKIRFSYEGESRSVIVPIDQPVFASVEKEIQRIKRRQNASNDDKPE